MATSLQDKINQLTPERRKKVKARSAQLIAEEMTLRDLRHAHKLTQERIAEYLNIGQDGVSRLEKRSDLLISTLRSYIKAMGGHLCLMAEFPNRPPVLVRGFSDMNDTTETLMDNPKTLPEDNNVEKVELK